MTAANPSHSKQMKMFRIPDVFDIRNGRNILKTSVVLGSGVHPYVTASEDNNSVVGYVDYDETQLEAGNCIFIGGKTMVISYQEKPFFSNDSHNLLLYCKNPAGCGRLASLYMITYLKIALSRYTWNSSISKKKIMKEAFMLPIQTDEIGRPIIDASKKYHSEGFVPDWTYMQKYIAELEQEHITKLKHYLAATGLNDYTLTDSDLKVLSLFKLTKKFRVGDIFSKLDSEFYGKPNTYAERKKHTATAPDARYTIPLTCAKIGDNGIMYYGETGMFSTEPNCLTMIRDGAVSTGLVYAQEQPTGVLSHSYLMKCKANVAFETLLYCASVMTKALYPLYTRDHPPLWEDRVENDSIVLPIKMDATEQPVVEKIKRYHPDGFVPDWDYMAAYIRAIEKLVVKDVVDFKDTFVTNYFAKYSRGVDCSR